MTTTRERRLAAVALGVLAAALLVAGGLPWVTGGALVVRLIASPLLLVGVLAAVTAARLPSARLPHRSTRPARPAARPHHCAHCSAAAADPPGADGAHQPA